MNKNVYLSLALAATTAAGLLASCSPGQNKTIKQSDFNNLQVLKTDFQVDQAMQLDRIKAEYLIENNGYKDNDVLTVMISLKSTPTMDIYLEKNEEFNDVSSFEKSSEGLNQLANINKEQNALIKELSDANLISSVEHRYSTLINAISVEVKYKDLATIANLKGVSKVTMSDTYSLPLSTSSGSEASAIINDVDVYETGIFNSGSVPYTGIGTAVAILDSGFDCSHEVFARQPDCSDDQLYVKRQDVIDTLSSLNAYEMSKQNIDIEDVYVSKKIPFAYDYADKDADVNPYDSEHGTHVAGIIGGKSETITGVAINTQLVLMKVFPDLQTGAETDDILKALEDAVKLKVDAINLSLGTSCGFVRAEDGDLQNEVYDKIGAAGISLLAAASNDFSAGYGGPEGNTNMVTNPDSGTVGSPSTYNSALSVASISGVKSRYLYCNDSQVVFYNESLNNAAKENDFYKELGLTSSSPETTFEYVTVPGDGIKVSFNNLDLTGKIALVRRGTNTFEEKSMLAKNAGAVACIIYNNIDGDILMSMGKTDHIPTISISKDDGEALALKDNGTITIGANYEAGPFISDYSSWGPTPSLNLKPEITAHGGKIYSSVPGNEYDELSGTSMATPNLCGVVIVLKQYIKDNFPEIKNNPVEINKLCNQLLMSTANITLNQYGTAYSPRKQGAGLATLKNAVNTKGLITIDNSDKTKIELFDDPLKTGVYNMKFNVKNLSNEDISYDLGIIGETESVSTFDTKHVAEKPHVLQGDFTAFIQGQGSLKEKVLTVKANETVKVDLTYTLTQEDKDYIDELFPYGMYVEGFVTLTSRNADKINLNCPFLGFYGDWTVAPLFDKTYYEVESEAHNGAIDDEDKIKADYWATTPYGSYYYSYIIPLGTYLYDMPEGYDAIPASEEHIAISNILGTIDGIYNIYAGLLRDAKTIKYTITDNITGEVIWENTDNNCIKAHFGGQAIPYFHELQMKSYNVGLVNNRSYTFNMDAFLDYGDGGKTTNIRNNFQFDFVADDEAPVVKNVSYEKIYDKNLKKDRYYINMTVYDNQYVMSIAPIAFTSNSTYTYMTKDPIPVYGEKGSDTTVRFEITDILENLEYDQLITTAIGFAIDDYALNSNLYLVTLPGTNGDLKFTKDGDYEGTDLVILSVYQDEIVNLNKYVASTDPLTDDGKDYLKSLKWTSSNEDVCEVKEGLLATKAAGKAVISITEGLDGRSALLIVNVKEKQGQSAINRVEDYGDKNKVSSIRFSYFDTIFAYSRAAQTSEIGQTGSREYILSTGDLSFYPGEKIQLGYDFDPWYAIDNYKLTWNSSNPSIATVDDKGVVTGLKEGTTIITLSLDNSTMMAKIRVTIKNEFVIENRTLIAYKGLGGKVVIPDDEGILYIGSFAFCLYDTDYSVEIPEDDLDAAKIPNANTTVTEVIIPDGVEEIQKYAFYNCSGLRSVTIPDTIKFVREYAFYNDEKLEEINTEKVIVIGANCFYNTKALKHVDLSRCYAIGRSAFEKSGLESVDLSHVRTIYSRAFKDTTNLTSVTMVKDTALASEMFVNTGLTSIDIYGSVIPTYFICTSKNLKKVTIHNDVISVGYEAFGECEELTDVEFKGKVEEFADLTFYKDSKLETITLPNCAFKVGNYMFAECSNLKTVKFGENTKLETVSGSLFKGAEAVNYIVNNDNTNYVVTDNYLMDKSGNIVLGTVHSEQPVDLIIDSSVNSIGPSAFAGANIKSLTITNPNTVIGNYAFGECDSLEAINLPEKGNIVVGEYAFAKDKKLATINNSTSITTFGKYALSSTGSDGEGYSIKIKDNAIVNEGTFIQAKVTDVEIGENAEIGFGAFQNCAYLLTVKFAGNAKLGKACFAKALSLKSANLEKITTIASEAFYGCKNMTRVDLSAATTVEDYAFADCAALSTVILKNVTVIGEGAFARYDTNGGAPTFVTVELPNTLTTIKDGAFLGCEGLTTIVIPDSVTTMGDYIFAYDIQLETVVISKNVDYAGKYCFAGCNALTSVNTGNIKTFEDMSFASTYALTTADLSKATFIGTGAFASSALRSDVIAPDLEEIGEYAFQNCLFTSFSADKCKKIGEGAFDGCKNLSLFIVPSNLESVGYGVWKGCEVLEDFMSKAGSTNGKINDHFFVEDGILYEVLPTTYYALVAVPRGKDITVLTVKENTSYIYNFAGNENKHVEYIELPDSLKLIGEYAFYGYDKLQYVEFKSYSAPFMEDRYNYQSVLEETDPGFNKLHYSFDLFGYELYYYNFIDLIGKKEPITMILPSNADILSYSNLVYETYFTKASEAERSSYVAKDANFIKFVESAREIAAIEVVTLSHKNLIEGAVIAYNAIKQDHKQFGYTDIQWNEMVDTVNTAKEDLRKLQYSIADAKVKKVQAKLDELPNHFSVNNLELLQSIVASYNALSVADRKLLDTSRYNVVVEEYEEYLETLNDEIVSASKLGY